MKKLKVRLWCKKIEGEGENDGGVGVRVRFVSFIG